MATAPTQTAREHVLAELAQLATQRKRALTGGSAVLVGAVFGASLLLGPSGLRPLIATSILALVIACSLGLALGVPLVGDSTLRWGGVLCGVAVVGSVALLAGDISGDTPLGMNCFVQGVGLGVVALAALSLTMGKLWRRSVDVRWPASLGGSVLILAIGTSVCGDEGGLHLWIAHLPVVPAVYAVAWSIGRFVRRSA